MPTHHLFDRLKATPKPLVVEYLNKTIEIPTVLKNTKQDRRLRTRVVMKLEDLEQPLATLDELRGIKRDSEEHNDHVRAVLERIVKTAEKGQTKETRSVEYLAKKYLDVFEAEIEKISAAIDSLPSNNLGLRNDKDSYQNRCRYKPRNEP